jgi:hypothetical protein
LQDAELRKIGHRDVPLPPLLTADGILEEGWDGQLVRIEGLLVERSAGRGQRTTLVLDAGNLVFAAQLPDGPLPPFRNGSALRVTGITSIEAPEAGRVTPRGFSLLLRSPADVIVLHDAP